jgi:hypothetical protein
MMLLCCSAPYFAPSALSHASTHHAIMVNQLQMTPGSQVALLLLALLVALQQLCVIPCTLTLQCNSYTLAADNQQRKVLRVVCRWDFSPTLTKELLDDLQEAIDWLEVRQGLRVCGDSAVDVAIMTAV